MKTKQHCLKQILYILSITTLLLFFGRQTAGQEQSKTQRSENEIINTLNDSAYTLQIPDYGILSAIPADSAAVIYKSFISNARKHGFSAGITSFALELSRILASQGSYASGLAILRYALPYSLQSSYSRNRVPLVYNNIGNMYLFMGQYKEASQAYYHAIQFAEKNPGSAGIEYAYANIVGVFNLYNKLTNGLYYLEKAEKLAIRQGNQGLLESIIINRGIIYILQGNKKQAEQQFLTALKWAETNNRVQLRTQALKQLARLHLQSNQPEKALPYVERAYRDTLGNPYYEHIFTLVLLGETYMAQQRYQEAERLLLKALKETEKKQMNAKKAAVHEVLSNLYYVTGRYQEAYKHNNIFATELNELKNLEIAENLNQLEVKYRTAEKDKEIFQKQMLIARQERDLKHKNIWIISISSGILILLLLFTGTYRANRHRQQISQLKASISGEEKERARIARDLHDGIGGMLASLKMHFSALPANHHYLASASDYQEALQILDETANEVRVTAHNLMPELLLRYGFEEAMRIFCNKAGKGHNLSINFQCLGMQHQLDKNMELSLYRMLQELVQNIIKHANATEALVQVNMFGKKLEVMVEDNGEGIDLSVQKNGMGLESLRQRIRALNGSIDIDSTPGKGTTVYLQFDIDKINFS